jgi:hypothetical protein
MNAVQEELANAITSDGTALSKIDRTQLAAKLKGGQLALPSAKTSSGSYTTPAGTNWVRFFVVGSGGGGAGCVPVSGSNVQGGAPGGAGS